jgi:UDP-glucose 4-epimerase
VKSGASIGNVVPFPAAYCGADPHDGDSSRVCLPGGGQVVVLGGTGFIGSAVTRKLVDDGSEVTVVARRAPTGVDLPPGARVLQRDAADPAIYDEVLDGASAVVYAVGCLFPGESNADPLADIHGSLTPLIQLLEALRQRPEVPMVFLSSGGTVYGNPKTMPVTEDHPTDPTTSYGILKLAAEKYVGMYRELYGLEARVLRVANAYGPGQLTGREQGVVGAFLDRIVRGMPVTIFGTGRNVRDYIQIDDVAHAVVSALTAGGAHTVNIGTGIGTSLLQIVQQLEGIAGHPVEIDFRPSRGFDVDSIVLDVAAF